MGCASSSPLTVNGGPGGLVESAKTAATEIMSTGEKAMNDVGENIAEQVTHTKDTIVESINGVANSISSKMKDDAITEIPLKDSNDADDSHLIEENFENLKNEMLSKAQNAMDDAEKIADDLIKDTEDVIRDAETGIVDMKNEAMEKMDAMKEEIMEEVMSKSPAHSLDSLKTSVPEPEIENLLNGETDASTVIEATVGELEDLNKVEEESEAVKETLAPETDDQMLTPSTATPEEQMNMMKTEDDLVVEDVKSTDEVVVTTAESTQIGKKLEKSFAVDEADSGREDEDGDDESSSIDEDSQKEKVEVEPPPPATQWEEMHDIYFKKRFSRNLNASVESLMEDEELCTINLANMYDEHERNLPMREENEASSRSATPTTAPLLAAPREAFVKEKLSSDTLDVIDDLIKSIEKEVASEEMNVEIPIVSVSVEDIE